MSPIVLPDLGSSGPAMQGDDIRRLKILLVTNSDVGGGAQISAWNLFDSYRKRGQESWLAAGIKRTGDPNVIAMPKDAYRNPWARFWLHASDRLKPLEARGKGYARLRNLLFCIAEPRRQFAIEQGHEDFDFPATWRLLQLGRHPDIVHCFNLHSEYFDLRALPWLSRQQPVILDLRDAWLLSGHCAHSLDCDRWKTGCGECPDLSLYPSIQRDGTSYNWSRKQKIFAESRVYVATPSQWLMRRVQESILAPAILESRVIPTGIHLSTFHPASKKRVRDELGLPQDAHVLLSAAYGIRANRWKDYKTMREAVSRLSEKDRGRPLIFIALGENAPDERIGNAHIKFVPLLKDSETVARYYQASDLYIHAAAADTFPRAVVEALACGTPVVATNVGGIPEQIRHLGTDAAPTGVLVAFGDAAGMAAAVDTILTDDGLHATLSQNAVKDAQSRFDAEKQTDSYLAWYQSLVRGAPSC